MAETVEELKARLTEAENRLKAEQEEAITLKAQLATAEGKVRSERVVYIPRDRKIRNLAGRPRSDDDPKVEDWIEDVRCYFSAHHLPDKEKVDFILTHLEGEARNEVRYRSNREKEDPDRILEILIESFGNNDSLSKLQQNFYDRYQKEGESLRCYSHGLMELLDRVMREDSRCVPNRDRTLCSQFSDNLRDKALHKHLKQLMRRIPTISFLDLREEAIRWAEEEEICRPKSRTRPTIHETVADVQKVEDPIARLTKVVEQQQQQIAELTEAVKQTKVQQPARRGRGRGYSASGERLCYVCHKPGHIKSECPQRQVTPGESVKINVSHQGVSEVTADSKGMIQRTVSTCPVLKAKVSGVEVNCLMDTGSMVSTISESFFKANLQSVVQQTPQSANWLTLRAANGLDIPYSGYLELDFEIDGHIIPSRGVLVVRDNANNQTTPGLIGMNIISQLPGGLKSFGNLNVQCKQVLGIALAHTKAKPGIYLS